MYNFVHTKETKIMTRKEILKLVNYELRHNSDDDLSLLTLVETFINVGDGNMTSRCGNLSINITSNRIELVDIRENRAILTLEVNYNG